MREGNTSHLKIHAWNTPHQVVVNSHIWLKFTPRNKYPNPNFSWQPIVDATIRLQRANHVNNVDLASHAMLSPLSRALVSFLSPWERDDWRSKLNLQNLAHLHKVLGHPVGSSMTQLFRQQSQGRMVPQSVKDHIEKL